MRRSAIYTTLAAQLEQLVDAPVGVKQVIRGFVHWDAVDVQPAICLVPAKEQSAYKLGFPTKWLITMDVWVYVKWVAKIEDGAQQLALIMDAIENIIAPLGPNGGINPCAGAVNTLGGLVTYAALQGTAELSIGYLNGNQAIARMPVEILVPA